MAPRVCHLDVHPGQVLAPHRLQASGHWLPFQRGLQDPSRRVPCAGPGAGQCEGWFDSSEAFVGSVAGLATWGWALVPREVSDLATGKELPMGPILTLANTSWVGRFVQRVNCTHLVP